MGQVDLHDSPFVDVVDVLMCDGVEVFEEVGVHGSEDASRLSGVVGPEWQKVFWWVPASCDIFCGMRLLDA